MTELTVVTSFSDAGRKEYGHRLLTTFARNWEHETTDLQWYRDINLLAESNWLAEFKLRHKDNPAAHGRAPGKTGYRWDCVRFAHKIAAILCADASLKQDSRYLLWLDADIIVHAPVTREVWRQWLPLRSWLSYLPRNLSVASYPECGFLLFDRLSQSFTVFRNELLELYRTDRVLSLYETHDSFVIQYLLDKLNFQPRSLSGAGYDHMHVLVHSPLGAYLDHCKGSSRKQIGRTPVRELQFPRLEPYWKK